MRLGAIAIHFVEPHLSQAVGRHEDLIHGQRLATVGAPACYLLGAAAPPVVTHVAPRAFVVEFQVTFAQCVTVPQDQSASVVWWCDRGGVSF